MAILWKCVAEPSGNPPGPAHAARTTHARTSDKIDALAACATLSATRPFHFVHTVRVLQREPEMLAITCLYSLYASFTNCCQSGVNVQKSTMRPTRSIFKNNSNEIGLTAFSSVN